MTSYRDAPSVTLKPCPFCGGPAQLTMFTTADWYGHWGVTCRDDDDICAATPWVVAGRDPESDRQNAVEMWNRRAGTDGLLEACKAAEEWLDGWASADPYIDVIRAAIAKAEGRQ